jgi:hypothetical protein
MFCDNRELTLYAFVGGLEIMMLGKMVEKQKVEILKMVERTKGRIAKCRNYY